MLFWEYLWKADADSDLADADRAWEWFVQQPWVPRNQNLVGHELGPGIPEWGEDKRREWTRCVHALRSLAHRLKGRPPRQPIPREPFAIEADRVADGYLMMLRLWRNGPR